MNEIKEYTEKLFENIKHIDENGNEYWLARELMPLLEYNKWERFSNAIEYAKTSCIKSGYNVGDHFPEVGKMVQIGSKTNRKLKDYKLSRYACYLIVQNGDSRKQAIALAQTYFAIQTRKQELSEKEYSKLTEDEKRFYQRDLTRKGNYSLNIAAKNAGVKNFDRFHNFGYKGLYNGETANDIAKRKNLRYREDILDNMGSDELIANLFRISLTEQKLLNEDINLENDANQAHYDVGKDIRETIKKQGGTLPENLPTPGKSLKELEKERKIKIYNFMIKNHEYDRLSDDTKNKIIKSEQLKVNDLVPNPIIIKTNRLEENLTEYTLKQSILNNLDEFLLQLGTYVGNKYRIKIGNNYM